jgi:type IV pilus assembly protein PilO
MSKQLLLSSFLGIIIILAYLGLSSTDTDKKKIQEEINSLELKIEELKLNSDIAVLRSEIKKTRQELLKESSYFPTKVSLSHVLREMSLIGKTSGLKLLKFEPLDSKNYGIYEEIPIKVKLSGNFRQIASFFYGVSSLDRVIKIGKLEIKGPVNRSAALITETDALITTYRILGGA